MEKIKSLLLPLAFIFAAIAIFEFGARYGATNMRAHAIASELQFPLRIYAQAQASMDEASNETFSQLIDNGIAAGALHRQIWYLNKDAKATLDKTLTYALNLRGDAVVKRFEAVEGDKNLPALSKAKLSEIRIAVTEAKNELVNTAQIAAENKVEAAVEQAD